jgi:hypothetical protein
MKFSVDFPNMTMMTNVIHRESTCSSLAVFHMTVKRVIAFSVALYAFNVWYADVVFGMRIWISVMTKEKELIFYKAVFIYVSRPFMGV